MKGDHWKNITEENFKTDEDWIKCNTCDSLPKLWIFDNGCYAKCECNIWAEHMSIMKFYNKYNTISNYSYIPLKDNWNKKIKRINNLNKVIKKL
jgi:hypothetical protein